VVDGPARRGRCSKKQRGELGRGNSPRTWFKFLLDAGGLGETARSGGAFGAGRGGEGAPPF